MADASKPSDATKAYTYLVENIPKWFEAIEEIRKRVQISQETVSKIPVPVAPIVKKSGSVETIHDDNPAKPTEPSALEITSAPEPEELSPQGAARTQQALLAKRKRKTASALSGHQSGPSKYRTRTLIVVYYDSEVQKAFENLVRNIGAGRNLLRKGKMAARIESLSDFGQDSSDDDGDSDTPALAKIGYRPKLGITPYRTARARAGFGGLADSGTPDQFDIADKSLEKAQNLCEKGAHQFLRDGDCRAELDGCREFMLEVQRLANPEAEKYKAKDEQQRLKEQARQELEKLQQPTKRSDASQPIVPDSHGVLEVDDEVDDFDEELTLAALAPLRMRTRMAPPV